MTLGKSLPGFVTQIMKQGKYQGAFKRNLGSRRRGVRRDRGPQQHLGFHAWTPGAHAQRYRVQRKGPERRGQGGFRGHQGRDV